MPGINEIWTIGHSTHHLDGFVAILKPFRIEAVVDIRSFPGSRKFPHFNKASLEWALPQYNLHYRHLKSLGGRRKASPNSKNTLWRHPAFRGYADFMETMEFKEGILELEGVAARHRTVYMCAEALWWRCHRSMVSDYLKSRGWKVVHISGTGKAEEHRYTQPARIVDGTLRYHDGAIEFENDKYMHN